MTDKQLVLHCGRVNIAYTHENTTPFDRENLLEIAKCPGTTSIVVLTVMREMIESGTFYDGDELRDYYIKQTIEACNNGEYWLEYLNSDEDILKNINRDLSPKQRFLDVRERLDDSHLYYGDNIINLEIPGVHPDTKLSTITLTSDKYNITINKINHTE